jgi:hypothetical protein
MASVVDFLGPYAYWYRANCHDLNALSYSGTKEEVLGLLDVLWQRLRADVSIDADGQTSLTYCLSYYEYVIEDRFFTSDAVSGAKHAQVWAKLQELVPVGPQSTIVQAAYLVIMLGSGTRRGFVKLDEAAVDALWSRIPEEVQTSNLWYYLVAWAYFNNNVKYLEMALAHQTIQTTGWHDDYFWLRTNLMYLLVEGRAAPLDVAKTLRAYTHPNDFADFRNLFLARCEAAGIMTDELYALAAQREAELAGLEKTVPTGTPKIARVVKQG